MMRARDRRIGFGAQEHSDGLEEDFWDLFSQAGFGGAHFQILKKLKQYSRTRDVTELLDVINYATAYVQWHYANTLEPLPEAAPTQKEEYPE